jgi:hypothetical protein
MKKIFIISPIVAMILFISTSIIGCRSGDKGDPGPAGPAATNKPQYQAGSISGTLTGLTRTTDEAFTVNINNQYFNTTEDNVVTTEDGEVGPYQHYVITRYDSLGTSFVTFEFDLETYDNNGTLETYLYNTDFTIVSKTKKSNSDTILYFATVYDYYNPFDVSSVYLSDYASGGSSSFTYSNLTVNPTTGLISFDYSIELGYYNNSSSNTAYFDGSLSVTPYNYVYRTSSAAE